MLIGCGQIDVVVEPLGAAAASARGPRDAAPLDAADASAPSPADATTVPDRPDASDAATTGQCAYRQQSVAAGAATRSLTALAAQGLRHALCCCDGVVINADLDTDSFDGDLGPFVQGEPGGDVGTNAELTLGLNVPSQARVAGSVTVAGIDGLSLNLDSLLTVTGDLSVGGPLQGAAATVQVEGDGAVAGRIDLGGLEIGGELVQPAGSEQRTAQSAINAQRSAAVEVAPPCACAPEPTLDVVALVRDATATAMPVELPSAALDQRCGSYVLGNAAADSLNLVLTESAALYVVGDLQLNGDFTIDTQAGAELDLFIEGNVRVDGRIELGSKPGQGRVRVHVGGSGTIQLGAGGVLNGSLYAPGSELVLNDALTVYGALFVRRVAASGALTIHYDRSLARAE